MRKETLVLIMFSGLFATVLAEDTGHGKEHSKRPLRTADLPQFEKQEESLADIADIKKANNDAYERIAPAFRNRDQSSLAEIARNDDNDEIRQKATWRLTDQIVLADIAKTDKSEFVRVAAASRLTDQTLLAGLVKNDESYHVRYAAMRNLTDQTILEDFAQNSKEKGICLLAVRGMTNQTLLVDFVKTNKDRDIRYEAVMKIKDKVFLEEIARTHEDFSLQEHALRNLIWSTLPTHFGGSAEGEWMTLAAAMRTNNQAAFEKIVKTSEHEYMRIMAIRNLMGDTDIFAEISKNDTSEWVRQEATERLNRLKTNE